MSDSNFSEELERLKEAQKKAGDALHKATDATRDAVDKFAKGELSTEEFEKILARGSAACDQWKAGQDDLDSLQAPQDLKTYGKVDLHSKAVLRGETVSITVEIPRSLAGKNFQFKVSTVTPEGGSHE